MTWHKTFSNALAASVGYTTRLARDASEWLRGKILILFYVITFPLGNKYFLSCVFVFLLYLYN